VLCGKLNALLKLLPLFCNTGCVVPPSPVRKGRLLLFIRPLLLLFWGTPLFIGRFAPLGLANGTWPVTAGLLTMPVTALVEGFVPPRMSCMKKLKV